MGSGSVSLWHKCVALNFNLGPRYRPEGELDTESERGRGGGGERLEKKLAFYISHTHCPFFQLNGTRNREQAEEHETNLN